MIQETLQQPYDRRRWSELLASVFPQAALFQQPRPLEDTLPDFIHEGCQLGLVRLADGQNLAIFEIRVADHVNLQRNRVALRDFINRYATEGVSQGVLCVFNSSDPAYRFTFACKQTGFDDEGNIVTTETNPRRFTYILGPGETRRTAAQRFAELARHRDQVGMKQVIDAFSVERLNKEFFDRYKEHYQRFVTALTDSDAPARLFGITTSPRSKDYEAACKPVRDWVKKMLGRLVFLHFLQKKGWLGCPAGSKDWHAGDPRFLHKLFDDCPEPDRFYTTRLAPLFFDALNQPDRKGDIFALTGTRVPYLNGGLFEAEDARPDFSAQLFRDLLEFLASYNFTIDETDPEENEIGIDPEMLGHIFENLLEDNKDKGAYYTPKSIVQYMCQQSVLSYLRGHLGEHGDLDRLVLHKDAGGEHSWVRKNARAISTHLADLKACDPAIGSGAFPIGLLQEIFWIKLTLDPDLDPADTKRRIIQNSIYGVDIDPGAVEIARLRFWLALVVDEKEPQPLPNLDYKIMQGDSLLESFEGIDLSKVHAEDTVGHSLTALIDSQGELQLDEVKKQLELKTSKRRAAIVALMRDYFSTTNSAQKQKLHRQIDEQVRDHIKHAIDYRRDEIAMRLHRIKTEIAVKKRQARGWKPSQRDERAIAMLTSALQMIDASAEKLAHLEEKPERPFFLWHLFFPDAFTSGGFDIVIANPPYVRADNPEALAERKKVEATGLYQTLWEKWDLYVAFIEKGYQLLRPDGVLCFIVSDAYCHSKYAIKSQRWFLENARVLRLDFLSELQLFDAAVRNVLFFFRKADGSSNIPERRVHRKAFGHIDILPSKKQVEADHRLFFPEEHRDQGEFSCRIIALEALCYVTVGMVVNANEKIAKGAFKMSDLVANKRSKIHSKRFAEGKDLQAWRSFATSWLEWNTDRSPSLLRRPTFPQLHEARKILVQRSPGPDPKACLDDQEIHFTESTVGFVRWCDLKGVRNRSIRKQASYRDERPKADDRKRADLEKLSERFDPKYLVAVMNSSTARDWLRARRRSNIHMYPDDWKPLPIPDVSPDAQAPIISLVEKILAVKQSDPDYDISAIEERLDAMVAALYRGRSTNLAD